MLAGAPRLRVKHRHLLARLQRRVQFRTQRQALTLRPRLRHTRGQARSRVVISDQ